MMDTRPDEVADPRSWHMPPRRDKQPRLVYPRILLVGRDDSGHPTRDGVPDFLTLLYGNYRVRCRLLNLGAFSRQTMKEQILAWNSSHFLSGRGKFACASQEIGHRKSRIWSDSQGWRHSRARKVDIRPPGKGNSDFHGARPVY